MKTEIFFKSLITAGIFMAKLATKYGTQSELHSMSSSYRVSFVCENKSEIPAIKAYADGLQDGMEVK